MRNILIEIIIVITVLLPIWGMCWTSKNRDIIITELLKEVWDENNSGN